MTFNYLKTIIPKYDGIKVISRYGLADDWVVMLVGMTIYQGKMKLYCLEYQKKDGEPTTFDEIEGDGGRRITNRDTVVPKNNETSVLGGGVKAVKIGSTSYEIERHSTSGRGMVDCTEILVVLAEFIKSGLTLNEALNGVYFGDMILSEFTLGGVHQSIPEFQNKRISLALEDTFEIHEASLKFNLEIGKEYSEPFELDEENSFYINNVELLDMYKTMNEMYESDEAKTRFSAEKLPAMKEFALKQLEESGLEKDDRLLVIEYESDPTISVNFYPTEFLDTFESAAGRKGSSIIAFYAKPDTPEGKNGLPTHAYVVNQPFFTENTKSVETEVLFFTKSVPMEELFFERD